MKSKSASAEVQPEPFSLNQSTYTGSVSEIMQLGEAQPFIQPWYTPISCTARDTGMPMGGIGNAFTLTPAGTTPVLSLMNGLHVTAPPSEPVRLHNLFFAERALDARLLIAEINVLRHLNRYLPLARMDGRPWMLGTETPEQLQTLVDEMAHDPLLYKDNIAALKRWHVTLSPRTIAALALGDSPELSRALLLDVYGLALRLESRYAGSLTGNIESNEIAGQPTYPSESIQYTGLYPVAETIHKSSAHALRIKMRNFSPVICGDERACSLPVSVTEVFFENPTDEPLEATIAWTLENLCGDHVIKVRPGVQDAWFQMVRTALYQEGDIFRERTTDGGQTALGIALSQAPGSTGGDFSGGMALALECESPASGFFATAHSSFYAVDENRIVTECLGTGRVVSPHVDPLATGRERRMGALCATVIVAPGGSRKISFALTLDFSAIRLHGFASEKKYVTFFPESEKRAKAIAVETLFRKEEYLSRITADHAAIEQLGAIPELLSSAPSPQAGARFKTLLANNLGFLADATVWDKEDRFWVRECADYPFFNSLDVYFYGSFSVLRLLPRLDGRVLLEFAKAILTEDATVRRHWEYCHQPYADLPDPRHQGPRSVIGAVPHDMGSPFDPKPDAYTWHNVKHWKDLAPKFLLMVWRHYRLTGDKVFLAACREASFVALKYLSDMRAPGETIPLTHGTDDTFDNMASYGISIYCGSLWVAALSAGAAIADATGHRDLAEDWRALGTLAHRDLVQSLWDEESGYYRFYKIPGSEEKSEDVFADQLLADLWLGLLGLPEITPKDRRRRAARTVLETNFRKNSPGVGAANASAKNGQALDSFQAQDIWLGVQYSLAAVAAESGETAGAWELMEAQYDNLYQKTRIPFGAPEGFNASVPESKSLQYTAGRYLRPGMAWVFAFPRFSR
jgi:non-lysosomal glucosylceramidase